MAILNDPDANELALFARFSDKWGDQVIVKVVERETLYRSWNRAIDLSSGDLIAMSNIDDVRTEDGLEHQLSLMDTNPETIFCYGSFEEISHVGQEGGKRCHAVSYDRESFIRGMYSGPFFIWRKVVDRTVQYFDEQFSVAGDYDFQVRLSLQGQGAPSEKLQGYYFNEQSGLSTSGILQLVEGNVIYMRYGVFDKINLMGFPKVPLYNLSACKIHGAYIDLNALCPQRQNVLSLAEKVILPNTFRLLANNSYYLMKGLIKRALGRP